MSDKKNPTLFPSLFEPTPPEVEPAPLPEVPEPKERRAPRPAPPASDQGKFVSPRPVSKGEWVPNPRSRQDLTQDLTRRGYCVVPLPICEVEGEDVPALFTPKGALLAPDLYCVHLKRGDFFCCAQGKGRPAWFRKYARWHHGMDYALYEAYQKVQKATGKRVSLALQETASPQSPHQQSVLSPGDGSWLFIWLDEVGLVGEHMPEWPGGMKQPWRRGRNNQGGWLWPRNAMTKDPFDAQTIGDLLF